VGWCIVYEGVCCFQRKGLCVVGSKGIDSFVVLFLLLFVIVGLLCGALCLYVYVL